MVNAADKSTATQTVRSGGLLWLNPIAMSVVDCNRAGVGRVFLSKTVLVRRRLEIFVDRGMNQTSELSQLGREAR